MSTPITYNVNTIPETRRGTDRKEPNWLQRVFDRLLAAREAQTERYLVDYLSALSNARLAELGYTEEQIRQIRVERQLPDLPN